MSLTPDAADLAVVLKLAADARMDVTVGQVTAAWSRAWDELAQEWREALDDLISRSEDGQWPTRAQITRSARAQAALQATTQALAELVTTTNTLAAGDLDALVSLAAEHHAKLLAAQLPPGAMIPPSGFDPRAVAAIVERTAGQITALTWPLSGEAEAAMRSALIRGMAVGDNPRIVAADMLRRVQGGFEGGRARAENIARTELISAMRTAGQRAQDAHRDVLAGWRWTAALSSRTCPACLSQHGRVFPLDEPGPQGHQSCLLPGVLVSGPRALASTTRWFDGEVIDIETVGGKLLSVTPNHPILTPDGWVPAGDLREGGYVLASTRPDRPAVGVSPDDYQVPALCEEIAQTLGGTSPVRSVRVPTSPEDFHGDGLGSDVHVVRTNGLLGGGDEPSLAEVGNELQLVLRDVRAESLPGDSGLHSLLHAANATPRGLVRGGRELHVLFGSARSGHEAIGVGHGAPLNPGLFEPVVDGRAGDAVGLRQGVGRLAREVPGGDLLGGGQVAFGEQPGGGALDPSSLSGGTVTPEAAVDEGGFDAPHAYPMPSSDSLAAFAGDVVEDRILKVHRRGWSGHVYNFQTETGWYIANGILTHNCRCARTPVTRTWRELGLDIDEPPRTAPTGLEWFDRQPEKVQRKILGPKRFKAWKGGTYPPERWAVLRQNPNWRPSYSVGPV